MSMDASMIKGTGLLELIQPKRKSKAEASGKSPKSKDKADEKAAESTEEAKPESTEQGQSAQSAAMSSPHSRAYLRFLALAAQTAAKDRSQSGEEALDTDEKALLELIILRWAVGEPMTVRQAIALSHLGSPATLHKRLMRLRQKTYLDLEHVSGDRRVKRLIIGPVGQTYLETMGRHMGAALQAGKKAIRAG
jgi:hypothetical protein